MSNYPPGVTGNEWQIAGVYSEDTVTVECPSCETEVEATQTVYYRNDEKARMECLTCWHTWDEYLPGEDCDPDWGWDD